MRALILIVGLLCLQDKEYFYDMPFPAGKTYKCLAGHGFGTHQGEFHHSWDFTIPVGEIVTAAREGTIGQVTDGNKAGMGVLVNHIDGTAATYGHLMRGGILVKKGEKVLKGEPLGKVGPEALGTQPHLHYHITNNEKLRTTGGSIPSKFKGGWIPQRGEACTSANSEPANLKDIRLLRRTLPLLKIAIRIKAEDLEAEMRKGIASALKNQKLADWAKPYESLDKLSPLELPDRNTLIQALRHDFKGDWESARALYKKVMASDASIKELYDAITPEVR